MDIHNFKPFEQLKWMGRLDYARFELTHLPRNEKKRQWNLHRNSKLFIHENALENVVCDMAVILSRGRCVQIVFEGYSMLQQLQVFWPKHENSWIFRSICYPQYRCCCSLPMLNQTPRQILKNLLILSKLGTCSRWLCVILNMTPYCIPAQLLNIQRQCMNMSDKSRIFTVILSNNTYVSSLQHERYKVKYLKSSDNGYAKGK